MVGTAIITGASQGIGRAIACRLSQDGFKVAINDLPSRKDQLEELHAYITQQGGTSIIILGDISVESEVKGMVDIVVERMGGIDVVRTPPFFPHYPHTPPLKVYTLRWSPMQASVNRRVSLIVCVTPFQRLYPKKKSFDHQLFPPPHLFISDSRGIPTRFICQRHWNISMLQICSTADGETRSWR